MILCAIINDAYIKMRLPGSLIEGEFLERLNRFSVRARIQGKKVKAYLPNSGRMKELLLEGARCYFYPNSSPWRSTAYDFLLVKSGKTLVSVDSRIPNHLLEEYFRRGKLPGFEGFLLLKREVKLGHSRLDFLLKKEGRLCYLETKSVTLNKDGTALFPDAPTERGRKHLETLIQARQEGHRAFVIFVAQREDSLSFSPNDRTDPDFGFYLRKAVNSGVEAHAYRCKVTLRTIKILDEIPVRL